MGYTEQFDEITVDRPLFYVMPNGVPTPLALHIMVADQDTALRNMAYLDAPPASVNGAPTFANGYASFKSNTNFITLGMPDANTCTTIFVVRNTDTLAGNATTPSFYGTYEGSTTAGQHVYRSAADAGVGVALATTDGSVYTGSLFSYADTPPGAAFQCYARTIDDAAKVDRIQNLTQSLAADSQSFAARNRGTQTRNMRFGSSYRAVLNGTSDGALIAHWNLVLSQPQIDAFYIQFKAMYQARFGITI